MRGKEGEYLLTRAVFHGMVRVDFTEMRHRREKRLNRLDDHLIFKRLSLKLHNEKVWFNDM
jgi:hypothetical protein